MILGFLAWLYFVPALVARERSHPNVEAIFVLNLLLGWTLIGWAAALIWALAKPPVVTLADGAQGGQARLPCPFCAEPILAGATVCRFCGRQLPSGWAGSAGRSRIF